MAAVLACGNGAALSHESAAALYGILDVDTDTHVSVPPGRQPKHHGIRIHRPVQMPPVQTQADIPVVIALDTLIDLARRKRPRWVLEACANEADKLGLIRIDDALEQLPMMQGRHGARRLYRTLTARLATDSDLERRFLRLVADAGLPHPVTQAVVCGFRVDFHWPNLGLVVETDGLTYHRTPSQQAKDRIRDQALTAAGRTTLRFTNAQVRRQPRVVAHTLRTVVDRLTAGSVRLHANSRRNSTQ